MHLVVLGIDKFDDGQDEILGFVERVENLVTGDRDGRRTGDTALDLDKAQFSRAGNAAFNVVA